MINGRIGLFDVVLMGAGVLALIVMLPLAGWFTIQDHQNENRCEDRGGVWVDHHCIDRRALR